jgi:histidinol phosphatase-like PHP family hydrolase
VTNSQLAELLAAEAERHADHRARALRRAAHRALLWPEEAAGILASGGSLTVLPAVGPWVARLIEDWLNAPPPEPPEVPPACRGFISMAEALRALDAAPEYRLARADLQVHTTWSDGAEPLEVMTAELAGRGYAYAAITDHSQGLKIAGGMDEETLARQWVDIDAMNEATGNGLRILKGLEMNLTPEGEGDMDPAALAQLDLVLGAFHSQLRVKEDQTERYLAALANPTVDVLAHPVARMYNRRPGLRADWPRVFAAAAERGVALEIDCTVARQDLPVELLKIARDSGAWFSMGTDAHAIHELDFMPLGLGAAAIAGIAPDRILPFRPADEVREWVQERRARARVG